LRKEYLKVLLLVSLIFIGLYCEKQNSRDDVISQASEEYLSKIDGTKPGELDSLLISGIASYGDGRKALAVRYFERAYELGDVRGAVKLYELYNTEKDEEKIKEWEVKAAEMGAATVQNNLALRLKKEGKYEEAEKWYLKAVKGGDKYAKNNLGVLYKDQGKYEEAEVLYKKAIEEKDLYAKNNLGVIYMKQEKYKEAEKLYMEAIDGKDYNALNNLGILYKEQGKYEEAEKWYLEALKYGDKNGHALYNLGELYEENFKDKKKAISWYKKAQKKGMKLAAERLEVLENE
jgi:tetratricopeptide (TPR) repeat protein